MRAEETHKEPPKQERCGRGLDGHSRPRFWGLEPVALLCDCMWRSERIRRLWSDWRRQA